MSDRIVYACGCGCEVSLSNTCQSCGTTFKCADIDAIQRERDELKAEVERLNKYTYCAWCGHEIEIATSTIEDCRAHIESCSAHPLNSAATEVSKLRAALVGLVGEDDPEQLRAKRRAIELLGTPTDEDRATLAAIDALLEDCAIGQVEAKRPKVQVTFRAENNADNITTDLANEIARIKEDQSNRLRVVHERLVKDVVDKEVAAFVQLLETMPKSDWPDIFETFKRRGQDQGA